MNEAIILEGHFAHRLWSHTMVTYGDVRNEPESLRGLQILQQESGRYRVKNIF